MGLFLDIIIAVLFITLSCNLGRFGVIPLLYGTVYSLTTLQGDFLLYTVATIFFVGVGVTYKKISIKTRWFVILVAALQGSMLFDLMISPEFETYWSLSIYPWAYNILMLTILYFDRDLSCASFNNRVSTFCNLLGRGKLVVGRCFRKTT